MSSNTSTRQREGGDTGWMKAIEVITNLHTDDVERAREFFGVLGLTEDTMKVFLDKTQIAALEVASSTDEVLDILTADR